jgi:hypothetical protein
MFTNFADVLFSMEMYYLFLCIHITQQNASHDLVPSILEHYVFMYT